MKKYNRKTNIQMVKDNKGCIDETGGTSDIGEKIALYHIFFTKKL